jgi:uncharacterized protein (DUF1800 family)
MKRSVLPTAGILAALSLAAVVVAKSKPKQSDAANEYRRAIHAVDRLTFGPRPGDADAIARSGVDNWIEQQLHPEKIDTSALQPRLATYRTLQMSPGEIAQNFPPNPLLKAAMAGKVAIPNDPYRHAIYRAGIARLENKPEENRAATAPPQTVDIAAPLSPAGQPPAPRAKQAERHEAHDQVDSLILLSPDARMQRILSLPAVEQSDLLKGVNGSRRQSLLAGLSPQQRETVIALGNPQGLVNYEAQSGKLVRAVYSDRQLEEVLTDFWFNHFNVYLNKGADRYLVTVYERDVIRPHVLGKFKDLLVATAQSPAMLFYLDNWQSEGPNSPAATAPPQNARKPGPRWVNGPFGPHPAAYPVPRPQQSGQPNSAAKPGQPKRRNGLNENYARELMELHTLGVNGGYTQQDVTEVARVFTGWTLQDPRDGGGFVFQEKLHEPGPKTVLGHKIKANGEKEGLQVLDILAHHASTAHFLSLQLAKRFVSDDPPPTLVNQMAATFRKTDGDLREVMRTLLHSQQFWAPEAYRAKVKTPFEFVVSALRATDADVTETQPLLNALNTMGMQIYGMQPPTGYSTSAGTWVNSAALLDRMNFALSLVDNKIGGVRFDAAKLIPAGQASDPYAQQAQLEQILLTGNISPQTHQTIESEIATTGAKPAAASAPPTTNTTVALLLGSPEFQRR